MSRLPNPETALIDAVRKAARQEQFLEVVSADEARLRFERHLDLSPLGSESVRLADALGRVLAADIAAPVDAPPFDRSGVTDLRFAPPTRQERATPTRCGFCSIAR